MFSCEASKRWLILFADANLPARLVLRRQLPSYTNLDGWFGNLGRNTTAANAASNAVANDAVASAALGDKHQ